MRSILLVLAFAVGCNGSEPRTSTATSAVGGAASDAATDSLVPSGEVLPASFAGQSTESGPGVPFDFTGTVTSSLPLTASEQAAIAAANALSTARNPTARSPHDRGFGLGSGGGALPIGGGNGMGGGNGTGGGNRMGGGRP